MALLHVVMAIESAILLVHDRTADAAFSEIALDDLRRIDIMDTLHLHVPTAVVDEDAADAS